MWPAAVRGRTLLTLTACVAAVTVGCSSSPPPPTTSTLTSWRLTYDVVEAATGDTQQLVVEVDRPYRARTRTYAADGALLAGSVWTEQALYLVAGDGTVTEVQPVAPGRPGPDVRLDVALPLALAAGLVSTGGTDTVTGRPCTIYVSRGPLDGSPPQPADDDESTESCVDDQGRILRDEWTLRGAVIRTRTATDVGAAVALSNLDLFGPTGPQPRPAGFNLLELRDLSQADEPPLAVALPASIAGLPLDLVVEARDVGATATSGLPQRLEQRATYTDGTRLVVLSQSRVLSGPDAKLPDGEAVSLPPLDDAVLTIGFDGIAVIGHVGDVRVELRGPLTRAELADVTLSLTN